MHSRVRPVELLGDSVQIADLRLDIESAARSSAKVLIVGETGSGKEVVARLVHETSAQRRGPFVAINCAGLPDSLLASELFGHVRGSFTGAYRDKQGLIRRAQGGTLFLDELGEMSLSMQASLLRFTESGEIQPVGADAPVATADVRLICATNRDLRRDMTAGLFREDLFYRLNVVHIAVPPLRDRGNDVLLLFRHFLSVAAASMGVATPELTPDAAQVVLAYAWPGNVREVRNVAERIAVAELTAITPDELPEEMLGGPLSPISRDSLEPRSTTAPSTQADLVEELWRRLMAGESFWTVVGESYRARALTRAALAALIDRGLERTEGSYRALLTLFNLPPSDYKRFHGYLYQRQSHLPVKSYRRLGPRHDPSPSGGSSRRDR